MVMETRSRIGRGMSQEEVSKQERWNQNEQGKDLIQVIEETERKRNEIKTIRIKQEVLEKKLVPVPIKQTGTDASNKSSINPQNDNTDIDVC